MTQLKEVSVPDIGGAESVEVIDVAVAIGQTIAIDDTLITLESDKASMDIPSPVAGEVTELMVNVGDQVSKGSIILMIDASDDTTNERVTESPADVTPVIEAADGPPTLLPLIVPDIGDSKGTTVIEVAIKPGQLVAIDDTLLTLESEKASMDLPSPAAGIVRELSVKIGAHVSTGDQIGMLEPIERPAQSAEVPASHDKQQNEARVSTPPTPSHTERPAPIAPQPSQTTTIHTTPIIRRLAKAFGVDLMAVTGTGRKGRILREDVQNFVKTRLQNPSSSALSLEKMPAIDFAQYGPVERVSLSRIKKRSASNLHRNWVSIPHVTQFDEVDITEMEAFRQSNKSIADEKGVKLTPLVFLIKAAVAALKAFPHFNASLAPDGDAVIVKSYYHIAVAVDTPQGLVVPVLRDVDQKGLFELADELATISHTARALKLSANDMRGACFTISSLGGIGGTAFTPIINAPDVAILGVSRATMKPVYQDGTFVPRLLLPLSLSYDHRVIDGADAARFITHMGRMLSDIRRLLL